MSLSKDIFTPEKVLVIPRKQWLLPGMTKKLFTGMLNLNQNQKQFYKLALSFIVLWYCLKHIPYSLRLAHSAHNCFKIALEMLFKIASQLAHSKMKVSFHEQLKWLCLLSEVMSDAYLGNGVFKLWTKF